MTIFSLYIINKAGGQIYQQDFASIPKLSLNDYLRVASTFHGLHAIAGNLSPVPIISGIESIETEHFKLQCFMTLTGVKFFLTASPESDDLDRTLHAIYEIYTDFVLKNPFYVLDMPIKCDLFDQHLAKFIRDRNREADR
eukprot:TRINITY_DN6259_c0_g2_i1.p1 TRINITY_DN6259_c0_g2~~TRINITY_DN6259_c0_g2_i1.p1  ORF type:complete len:140 (+),score=38.11 TRINITY_DN6259_c0_g2_i1:62-481(+)